MAANSKYTWIDEYPAGAFSASDWAQRAYRSRKEHHKSRKGCMGCKRRRIKCDESKPKCGQCLHRHVECEFSTDLSERIDDSVAIRPQDARLNLIAQVLSSLKEFNDPAGDSRNPILKQRDICELLDHFLDTTIPWLGSPEFQRILQKNGLSLATKSPYLLHAILSMSANHLSFLNPSEKRHSIAATIHYQLALTSYASQLGAPINIDNVDSIIGCGYVQTMLAFVTIFKFPEGEETDHTGNRGAATWLRAMQGMRILQNTQSIRHHSRQSIWFPVFLESGGCGLVTCHHTDEVSDSRVGAASKALHALCDVSHECPDRGNPYHLPLTYLCWLMRSVVSDVAIGRFMLFIGILPGDFIGLYEKNDPRAMLIMAYWCALLTNIDQWWTVGSALSKCRILCEILDDPSDSQLRDLLQFPAERCGYTLKA